MKKFLNLKNASDQEKSAINFVCIQGFMWFAWAFTCYGTAYLQNVGFTASTIGRLNATCSAVAIFSMMFWGMFSDKINSVKKTLITVSVVSVGLQVLIPFMPTESEYTVLIFFILYPVLCMFRNSMCPLLDSFSVRVCAEKRLNYSNSRSFGSFTFTVGSIIVSFLIIKSGTIATAYLLCGFIYIPGLISLFLAPDCKMPVKKGEKISVSPKPLFKNYHYMALLVFAAIIYIACTAEYGFITYFMEDIGVANSNLGNFLAVRAVSEIPTLFFIIKFRRKIKLKYLMMVAFTLMGLQCLIFSLFVNSLATMMITACLFGAGNGIVIGTVPFYLYKLAPNQLKATAQTIYSAVCSVAGIIGNLFGGVIYEIVGARTFYFGVGIIFFVGVTVFGISHLLRKDIVNPADELEV
ncbi:MAG: MFS transporter [Clostridia bacterium]